MPLDSVPTVESLRSATLRHRFGDLFNPPGLTNGLGSLQATLDPTGVSSVAFPPLSMGESTAFGETGSVATGVLFIDGDYAMAHGRSVEFSTTPAGVDRRCRVGGLEVSSSTILPVGQTAVLERIIVTNTGRSRARHRLGLAVQGNVTHRQEAWNWPQAPAEFDNAQSIDQTGRVIEYSAQHSTATVVQGCWPPADRLDGGMLEFDVDLLPGESRQITFAVAMASTPDAARRSQAELVRHFDVEAARCRADWDDLLRAAFTPDNQRFSGCLPRLETDDPDILRLYHTAVWTLLFHRRQLGDEPGNVAYTTLGPRYWQTTTFLWDISLAAPLLAQLDPDGLRSMVERWMELDVHQHFGTEYLSGEGVGPWYSVNDYAMCRMADQYLRWTGDDAWLDRTVAGRRVLDHLVGYATHWQSLDVNGHGLADYGAIGNLLEAVSHYTHEVAGLNAANVASMRFVADLLGEHDRGAEAGVMRRQASSLLTRVKRLYVRGAGFWNCRQPDGRDQPIRHCYDFATILTTIGGDLQPEQRQEMVRFFRRELMTPHWMRALSTHDPDVTYSVRPDHQWTGAYAAWPAIALMALYAAGESELAARWMRGLGATMRQGPVAQAYFAEDVIRREAGGARKAPSDPPWINDWSCVAGAAYTEPIISGLFGIDAPRRGRLAARPRLGAALASARLHGLRWHGQTYDVDAAGVHRVRGAATPGRSL